MKRLLTLLLVLLLVQPAYAQNPVTVSKVGTVNVTTTVPISGVITANLGTLNGLFLDATFTSRMPAGASPANGESNTSASLSRIGVYNFFFNGSTWDRWTGAVTGSGTFTVGQATGTNLHMVCDSGCSSSTAPSDEAAFTAGVTPQSVAGGFFQTTATSNPLGNGQMGALQVTANRALFTNLRNASGTELGVAAAPLQVSLANTAANATAVKVDGSAVTQPASIAGTVTVAGNKTNNNAAPGATNVGALGAIANAAAPTYTEGNLVLQSADLHGSTRITALDSSGAAIVPTTAGTQDGALGTITNVTAGLQMGRASAAAPTNVSAGDDAVLAWYLLNGSQVVNLAAGGNLIGATSNALDVNIKSGGGSGGTSAADAAAFTASSSSFTPAGGFFQTTATSNALTTGQMGAWQMTANRAGFVNLRNSSGTEVGTSGAALRIDPTGTTTQPVSLVSVPSHAVTVASGGIASGAIASGAVASGAYASGSIGSGAIASGAIASGAVASGAYAADSASFGVSATGAAPPAKAVFNSGLGSGATGGFLVGVPVADTFKAVSITSATTTLLITGVSGRHVRISSIHLVTAIANNVALISGTGATCGTGTAGIAGGTTAANGYNFAANGGITLGSGLGTVMQTAATGDSICAITSAAGPLAGTIAYAIY